MVKNPKTLQAFEAVRIGAEKVDIEQNFRILDALFERDRRNRGTIPKITTVPILFKLALVFLIAFAAPDAGMAQDSPSGEAAADELVAKIGERLASYPKLESWQARAQSTTSQMTSDWKPRKTTTVEKIVTVEGRRRSEEILSAVETEGGRTRDVTEKMRAEARERAEKQRRSTDDERRDEQRRRGRRGLDMARDEVLPFSPEKRSGYDFTLKGAAELEGAPVIVLQSRSKVRSEEKLEGLYYIDPATYDVLRAELTLAKKPGPLKRMEMEIDFRVLPEGHQVMTGAVMRMHIGLVVKNYRIEAVETYTDHQIQGHNTHSPNSSACGREKSEWVLCPQIML